MLNENIDLESLYLYKTLAQQLSANFVSLSNAASKDFSTSTGFNDKITSTKTSDLCVLVGVDPRTEGVILNSLIREGIVCGKITEVYKIGSSSSLPTYRSFHSSLNSSFLKELKNGTSALSLKLSKAQSPKIIFGSLLNKNFKTSVLFDLFKDLNSSLQDISSVSFLPEKANSYGLTSLNAISKNSFNFKNAQLNIFVGFDKTESKNLLKENQINSSVFHLSPDLFLKKVH